MILNSLNFSKMLRSSIVRYGCSSVHKQILNTRYSNQLGEELIRKYALHRPAAHVPIISKFDTSNSGFLSLKNFRRQCSTISESKAERTLSGVELVEETLLDEEKFSRSGWNEGRPGSSSGSREQRSRVESVSWTKSSDVPDETIGAFNNFKLSDPIISKLRARGISFLFPVQTSTFNHIYSGDDVVVQARTGSGKTLSYVIPLVEKLLENKPDGTPRAHSRKSPRMLVMTPTRELARQVSDVIEGLTQSLSVACIYGGAAIAPQESRLRGGVDVVVGTPGRILDMLEREALDLSALQHVVLDEVDRMLDMGFADSVDDILKHRYVDGRGGKENPQTLLFSATVPAWVQRTARKYLSENLVKIDLVGSGTVRTATTVEHLSVCCPASQRTYVISDMLKVYSGSHGRAIVFCETKRDADTLAVSKSIRDESHVLHGDIPQSKREMVLKGFREGRYKILIATDVAARGLDIPEVDLVIQCCPPKDVDSYIHRSGRTGRAGRSGVSILLYQHHERHDLEEVQRKAGIRFKSVVPPKASDIALAAAEDAVKSLEKVPEAVAERFRGLAQTLVERKGAIEALSAALAVVSGAAEEPERSLITNRPDFTTYIYRSPTPLRKIGAAYFSLEENIPEYELFRDHISNMRLLADNMGCVFDVPAELNESLNRRSAMPPDSSPAADGLASHDGSSRLQRATELPDIIEPPPRYSSHPSQQSWRGEGPDRRGYRLQRGYTQRDHSAPAGYNRTSSRRDSPPGWFRDSDTHEWKDNNTRTGYPRASKMYGRRDQQRRGLNDVETE